MKWNWLRIFAILAWVIVVVTFLTVKPIYTEKFHMDLLWFTYLLIALLFASLVFFFGKVGEMLNFLEKEIRELKGERVREVPLSELSYEEYKDILKGLTWKEFVAYAAMFLMGLMFGLFVKAIA